MIDDFDRQKSEFNMAVSTLNRINYSLALCADHRRVMELHPYFLEIQNLYIETSTEMKGDIYFIIQKYFKINLDGQLKKKTIDELKDEFKIMEKMIEETEPIMASYNHSSKNIMKTKELFKKLLTMEMFLRHILSEAGLLMKISDDPRFALARR